MKKLTFSLALTLCFLILLQTGCSLFSGSSGDSSVYIESEKSLLLKTRTDKEIDFTTDGFSFYLPADSLSGNKEISIESMLHFTNSDQKSFFTPVSKLYDINIFGNAIIMTKSAKLGFLVPAGLERNHLFAFRKTAAGKWHIFSELPQNQSGQAYFSSAYLSKWFLARRIRTNQTSLLSAPQISLSSEKLYYNSKKLFTEDILINCYFETVSSNLLQEHLFVHEITAQAETPFKLAFKTDAENLQNFDSAQSDNGLHLIKINSDVAEFKEIAANTASYTFCLKLNKEDARNYPENILIQALVTDSDNFTYENNIVLTAIEEPEPQPATSPIALEFSVPRNNESDVDPGNSITLAFNHPIDPESFLQSFSIAPQTASPTFNWNQTHKEVQISFKQGLTEETDYLISIHNNLQGQNKEILVQSLEIKFSTGETTPPEIKGFYPDESRLLPLNGNLQIIFSEPVKPDSLRLEIIPETSLVTELTNEILYIGPKNNWQPSTQYQITIMDGLSDLKNNQTQQTQTFIFYTSDQSAAKILSFTPESGFETASVSTSISILFDRGMKTDASEKAFIFPDNFPTTQFAWSDDFTQLLISFPLPLEFNSIYKFIISDSAEALDGTKLANQYSYQFKTISRPEVIAAELIPDQGATNIATNSTIMIPFNREMNQSSVEKAFILINENSEPIEGIFFWNLNRLEFKPHKPLSPGKTYKIFIGKSATDVFNNNIAEAFSSSFTTQPHARVFLKSHFPENQASNISFDSSIILEFSDAIAKETLSFSVEPPVKGGYSTKWENNDKKVSITFYAGFNSGATYQFLVSDSIRDKYEQNIIKPEPFNFTIEEYNYPRLIEILPANQSEKISPLTTITLLFDQPMNEESVISALEFEPEPDALIDYSWNSDSTKLIIEFSSFLEFAQTYVINLNRQAKNKNGLNLIKDYASSFITSPETEIATVSPASGSIDIERNSLISVSFTEPVDKTTAEQAFIVKADGQSVSGNFSWSGNQMIFTPDNLFNYSDLVVFSFTNDVKDSFGFLVNTSSIFSFQVVSPEPCEVTEVFPEDGQTMIAYNIEPVITFSSAMNPDTVTLTISPETNEFSKVWSPDFKKLQLKGILFEGETTYQLNISKNSQNAYGIELAQSYEFTFTTAEIEGPEVTNTEPVSGSTNINTDQILQISFNKSMEKDATENSTTLFRGLDQVNTTFSWQNNDTILLIYPEELLPGQTYTLRVGNSAKDTQGNFLSETFSGNFSTVLPPQFTMEYLAPANGITNAPIDQTVIASFSNSVKPETLSISYQPFPSSGFDTIWSENFSKLSIVPNGHLTGQTSYEVTIEETVKDIYLSNLPKDFSISFTTIELPAPEIVSTSPSAGSYNVSLDQEIKFVFTNSMNRQSVESAFSFLPEVPKTFVWSDDSKIFKIIFSENFEDGTGYQATIQGFAEDMNQKTIGYNFHLLFQTLFRPELNFSELNPADEADSVPTQSFIKMPFSKEMDLSSVQEAFSLKSGSVEMLGQWSQSGKIVYFYPDTAMNYSTLYDLNLNSLAKDIDGNHVKSAYSWSFTTAAEQGKEWTLEASGSGLFSERSLHQIIEYNDELYVIGGYEGNFLNDVWKSSDGSNWTKILDDSDSPGTSQFSQRGGHACTVFDGKIWLTGGFNDSSDTAIYHDDVWYSNNGVNWQRAIDNADYYRRAFHNLVVYNNQLWIIAGETPDAENNLVLLDDCWSSSNGIDWTLKSKVVTFTPRKSCAAGVIDQKLWIWGGFGNNIYGQVSALNDGWYTTNGDIWQLGNSELAFSPRTGMAFTSFAQKIWIIGGASDLTGNSTSYLNDVWISSDGLQWFEVVENDSERVDGFSGRSFFQADSLSDKIFITGGEGPAGFYNEVWSSN